jgi:hypothetical protein
MRQIIYGRKKEKTDKTRCRGYNIFYRSIETSKRGRVKEADYN